MSDKIIFLKHNDVKIGIIPHVGGRIVSLTKDESYNILSSDSSLWNHEFGKDLEEYTSYEIMQFRGLSTWVGPQSEWWLHQTLNPHKKKIKDTWPPDPFLDYGNFVITRNTNSSIELVGPDSRITGVRINKFYSITDNGNVVIRAIATNIREENIAWDLWLNTRLPGGCKSYVQVESKYDYRIETSPENEQLESNIVDGFFTFDEQTPSKNFSQVSAKAFISPKTPYIFSFNEGYLFVLHIELFDVKEVHAEHGMVEIYNAISHNTKDSLLELEYHSPYKTIKPQESIEVEQMWELIEYKGNNTRDEHIAFIKKWMSKQ